MNDMLVDNSPPWLATVMCQAAVNGDSVNRHKKVVPRTMIFSIECRSRSFVPGIRAISETFTHNKGHHTEHKGHHVWCQVLFFRYMILFY